MEHSVHFCFNFASSRASEEKSRKTAMETNEIMDSPASHWVWRTCEQWFVNWLLSRESVAVHGTAALFFFKNGNADL